MVSELFVLTCKKFQSLSVHVVGNLACVDPKQT